LNKIKNFFRLILIIWLLTFPILGANSNTSSTSSSQSVNPTEETGSSLLGNTNRESKLVKSEKGVERSAQNSLDSFPSGSTTVYHDFRANLRSVTYLADTETVNTFKDMINQSNEFRDSIFVNELQIQGTLKLIRYEESKKYKKIEAVAYLFLLFSCILSLIGLLIAIRVNAEILKYYLIRLSIGLSLGVFYLLPKFLFWITST
jgi:glycosyltransferase involved in cell wall biosynthesis